MTSSTAIWMRTIASGGADRGGQDDKGRLMSHLLWSDTTTSSSEANPEPQSPLSKRLGAAFQDLAYGFTHRRLLQTA
jgi:hypothetical protein